MLGVLAMCVLVSGCAQTGTVRAPTQDKPSPIAHLKGKRLPGHIAVLVMENSDYGSVVGPTDTSYITDLAHRYALATQYYAISHPSLPNYLALTGGSTFGITSDCTSCSVPATGLAGQLLAHHISWRAYAEDYPHPCYQGGYDGNYAKKHIPFLYYRKIAHRVACHYVVPFTALHAAIASRRLPRFAWITPNLCNDMHDCSKHVGNVFLQSLVPGLLRALGPRGLLFIVWDEGTNDDGCCRVARGGHVALIVAGGGAKAHAQMNTPVDHFSVLQTVEDLLGLPRLLRAGCGCTPSLQPLLAEGGSHKGGSRRRPRTRSAGG